MWPEQERSGHISFRECFRRIFLTLCAHAASDAHATRVHLHAGKRRSRAGNAVRGERRGPSRRALLRDAYLVVGNDQRARQTEKRNRIARDKTAGHDVDDVAAVFAGRDRALECDAVIARFHGEDDRVVASVAKRRHDRAAQQTRANVEWRTCALARIRKFSHESRNEWWIPRALRDQCLTYVGEYVLITTEHTRGAWRFP